MMKKTIMLTLLFGMPLMANANRYHHINYGTVIDVQPIYQHVSIPQERQVCDRRPQHHQRDNVAGRAILGGIIGGAIGNRFGDGRGRDASTALGVLIGAGVGANQARQPRRQNCFIETYYQNEERFMGYDVSYEYNNQIYHTQMQQHPGDRVRLRVDVRVDQ